MPPSPPPPPPHAPVLLQVRLDVGQGEAGHSHLGHNVLGLQQGGSGARRLDRWPSRGSCAHRARSGWLAAPAAAARAALRTLANAEPPSALTASTKHWCSAGDQRRRSRESTHTRSGSASPPSAGIATSSLLAELARPPLALDVRAVGRGGAEPEVGGPAGSPAVGEGLRAPAGASVVSAAALMPPSTREQPAAHRERRSIAYVKAFGVATRV